MNKYSAQLERDGYAVLRQAVPTYLIDAVLKAQWESRSNPFLIFRGQGVIGYERAHWNSYGQMIRSIQNPHLLGFAPSLSYAIERLVFSEAIAGSLETLTGINQWVNWQTMLFDRSVGTDVHLDTWFLDTVPKGSLLGAWIALEDIKQESGPFIVYPRSHILEVMAQIDQCSLLAIKRKKLVEILDSLNIIKEKLLLKKGDVVVWNSLLAHGSELPSSNHQTRKSVTAHFYPYGMKVREAPIKRAVSIYNHARPVKMYQERLYKAATVWPKAYSLLCIMMWLYQGFRGRSVPSANSIRRVS